MKYRNINLTQDSLKVSQQSTMTAQKALSVAQEGQVTGRFTRAIDQLGVVGNKGVKKIVVRPSGIYALERIANASERDQWPIVEVLCTYVRNVAPVGSQQSTRRNPPPPGYSEVVSKADLVGSDLREARLLGANFGTVATRI